MLDAPNVGGCSPSLHPRSNEEIGELEEWLGTWFPYESVPGDERFVPASNLINDSLSRIPVDSEQGGMVCTDDEILEQSRSKFLQVLAYHYDRQCMGGSQIFMPSSVFYPAYTNARDESIRLCEKLCIDKELDKMTRDRLGASLLNFVNDAIVKIGRKNEKNCLRYLERNKKNEMDKFAGNLKERYKFLHQEFTLNSASVVDYYNSKQMDQDVTAYMLESVRGWNVIKAIALAEYEGQENDSLRIVYNDDVESALNAYRDHILATNEKRVEKYMHESLDREYSNCKHRIDKSINEAPYLDDISRKDLEKHVDEFKTKFEHELDVLIENIESSKRSGVKASFKTKIEEKGEQLVQHGIHLVRVELEKELNNFHEDFETGIEDVFKELEAKYRLNGMWSIYGKHVSKALANAKLKVQRVVVSEEPTGATDSDIQNSRVGTSSVIMNVSVSNFVANGDMNGTSEEENHRPSTSFKRACESGDTADASSSDRPKRLRKQQSSAAKLTIIQ